MKKLLFVATAAALALSSCSDNEISTLSVVNGKTPVKVDVYQQSQTRAVTETSLAQLQANGFKLFALNGTNNLIATTVTYDASVKAWSLGADTYYWPSNETQKINFYGYFDASTRYEEVTFDAGQLTFPARTDNDIVVAYASKSLSEAGTDGSVSLSFKHVNAEVVVSAKGDNADFGYVVTEVSFSVPNKCVYTFATGATAAATGSTDADKIYTQAEETEISTTMSALNDEWMMLLPAVTSTMTVKYNVSDGSDTNSLAKTARVTLVPGQVNRVNVTLPHDRTAMSIKVDAVDAWVMTENVITPTLK